METSTRERPILFSGHSVRSILDGRKTVTRRVINPQPDAGIKRFGNHLIPYRFGREAPNMPGVRVQEEVKCPHGRPGDRLWVRENFWQDCAFHLQDGPVSYSATDDDPTPDNDCDDGQGMVFWIKKPSIHMPRWASRITLEVVDVRVERLQELTEEEAVAEGFYHCCDGAVCACDGQMAKGEFADLWDQLNAKRGYSWESNPWVWGVSFRRLTEDQHA